MEATNLCAPEHAALQSYAGRAELVERIMRAMPEDGFATPLDGLHILRFSSPTGLVHGVMKPLLCVIAQGSKEVLLGGTFYQYDPAHYLIATVDLPIASRIIEASPEQPFLTLLFDLDPAMISSVMVGTGDLIPQRHTAVTALDVSPLDAGLLDAIVRLVRLLEAPEDAQFLGPMIQREIIYRLLRGAQRSRLGHIAAGGNTHRIVDAIERLRQDFNQPLRIEDLARDLGMSASAFHHHFKTVTAMSPLQFQKQLRLQEARRLMLGDGLDAASAGMRVGYEDASHFNREYKRFFGAPPIRDMERLRQLSDDALAYEGLAYR